MIDIIQQIRRGFADRFAFPDRIVVNVHSCNFLPQRLVEAEVLCNL